MIYIYTVNISKQKFEAHIDLLLINEQNKSFLSVSKILTDLCSTRQNVKIKNHFSWDCLQYFSSENGLVEHKEICLELDGKQSVKLQRGTIKF